MSDAPRSLASRISPRRLGVVLGVWALLVGGGLLVASALDSPVGAGARDEARPAVPEPVVTGDAGSGAATNGDLPPLAMVLDHTLPADLTSLPPAAQAERLRIEAMRTRDPARFVELGSVLQLLGDGASAEASYRAALKFDPGNVAAEVGLALVDGAGGPDGLARGSARLAALAVAHPRDQRVSFNRGWLEIYRRRGDPARAAWLRTIALGPQTRLGRTAKTLVTTLGNTTGGRNP